MTGTFRRPGAPAPGPRTSTPPGQHDREDPHPNMTDEPPTSSRRPHLYPVTPDDAPFDPEYDTQPHDIELAAKAAERALLGTLLLHPEDAAKILPNLDPTDFSEPAHEAIWNAAADLYADGTTPDHPSLVRKLAANDTVKRAGGHRLLLDLRPDGDPTPQPEHWAQIIREAAGWRRVGDRLIEARRVHRAADPTKLAATLQRLSDVADDAATTFGPRTLTGAPTGRHDLAWILSGQPPVQDPPVFCHRTDGNALFYAGKVNGIFGDPECGKTWVAQTAIVEALDTGQTAAMIDVDHNGADHTAARLMLLGAKPDHLADPTRFRYYEPEDADELRAAVHEITTWAPAVYVLDSLGEVLPMLGVKSVDNDEITTALRTVCTPPASAGSAVITIDHLPKSAEARITGYAIGGTAKKRIMRGSYIRAEMRTQPAPGAIGKITLRIEKDTVGELRKVTPGGYAGTFILDSTVHHVTTWAISLDDSPVAADGSFRPTHLMEAVSRYVEDNDQCTGRDIDTAISGKGTNIRRAIECLLNEGFLTTFDGPRRSKLHHSKAHYRQAEDDQLDPSNHPTETGFGDVDVPLP